MPVYQDSFVTIWHGPRRGGKSVSMAAEECIQLLNGRRVFADSPVQFLWPNDDGSWSKYASEPLDYKELIFAMDDPELKKKFTGAIIAWDEVDKWLFSRNFQSVFSKITSQFITLIGKLEMTFLMTAQFIHLVDKNIRVQVDSEIECTDLSFMYPHLGRGTNIGWLAKDMSGRYTGRMYQDTGTEYQTTFYAMPFWEVYDTKKAPSILDSMQKIEIKAEKQVWDLRGGGEDLEEDLAAYRSDENIMIIEHLVEEIRDSGTYYTKAELLKMARERQYTGPTRTIFDRMADHNLVSVGRNQYAVV